MDVKIADLRHRITFQTLERTPDGQGGFQETWSDFETVWAKIETASAGSRYFAQRIEDIYDQRIIVRSTGLSLPIIGDLLTVGFFVIGAISGQPERRIESMRIKFKTRYFQIQGVHRKDERLWWTEIRAKENVGS